MKISSIYLALMVASSTVINPAVCYGFLSLSHNNYNAKNRIPPPHGNSMSYRDAPHQSSSHGSRSQSFIYQSKREDGEDDRFYGKTDASGRLPPPQNRRTRNKNKANNFSPVVKEESGLVQLLESSINVLTTPIPVFGYNLPIVYPAMIIFGLNFIPPTTWVLSTALFGIYLWLGMKIVIDPDNQSYLGENGYNIESEKYDEEDVELFPLVAFSGAVASAALVSPQGLLMESTSWFSEVTSTISLVTISVAFGLALLSDVKGIGDAEEQLEVKERQDQVIRNELRRMDKWDDDLNKKST